MSLLYITYNDYNGLLNHVLQPFLIGDVHIEGHDKPYCLSPGDYATLPAGSRFDPSRALQVAIPNSRQTLLTICDP